MKFFLDTSALIKLFHRETGSGTMSELASSDENEIWLSELLRVEYKSALYRKLNNGQISNTDFNTAVESFEEYFASVQTIPLNSAVINEAETVFDIYSTSGIRTLDAIQFACFKLAGNIEMIFVSADNKLCSIVSNAGFQTLNPVIDTNK